MPRLTTSADSDKSRSRVAVWPACATRLYQIVLCDVDSDVTRELYCTADNWTLRAPYTLYLRLTPDLSSAGSAFRLQNTLTQFVCTYIQFRPARSLTIKKSGPPEAPARAKK